MLNRMRSILKFVEVQVPKPTQLRKALASGKRGQEEKRGTD